MLQSLHFTFLLGLRVGWGEPVRRPNVIQEAITLVTGRCVSHQCQFAMASLESPAQKFPYDVQLTCRFLLYQRIHYCRESSFLIKHQFHWFQVFRPHILYIEHVQKRVFLKQFGFHKLQLFHSSSISSLRNFIGLRCGGYQAISQGIPDQLRLATEKRGQQNCQTKKKQSSSDYSFGRMSSNLSIDYVVF